MGGVICIYVVIDISIDIDIFLIISACVSSSPAFYKMCFAYKLNKQGDNIVVFHHPPRPISNHLFFYIWFSLLFLDLDTGLSGGR